MSDIARHAMRGMQCAAFHAVKPAVIKRLELAQCNPPPP
jgi:hypothetical protein